MGNTTARQHSPEDSTDSVVTPTSSTGVLHHVHFANSVLQDNTALDVKLKFQGKSGGLIAFKDKKHLSMVPPIGAENSGIQQICTKRFSQQDGGGECVAFKSRKFSSYIIGYPDDGYVVKCDENSGGDHRTWWRKRFYKSIFPDCCPEYQDSVLLQLWEGRYQLPDPKDTLALYFIIDYDDPSAQYYKLDCIGSAKTKGAFSIMDDSHYTTKYVDEKPSPKKQMSRVDETDYHPSPPIVREMQPDRLPTNVKVTFQPSGGGILVITDDKELDIVPSRRAKNFEMEEITKISFNREEGGGLCVVLKSRDYKGCIIGYPYNGFSVKGDGKSEDPRTWWRLHFYKDMFKYSLPKYDNSVLLQLWCGDFRCDPEDGLFFIIESGPNFRNYKLGPLLYAKTMGAFNVYHVYH